MAQVVLTIPDIYLSRVVHALCVSRGVPESAANAKATLIAHVKEVVRRIEAQEAELEALAEITVPPTDDIVT